jgi:formylglycine-generating enzyme required for sulfatase activity
VSEDIGARIASLAQDYREGRLNRAAYRRLRAPLLDSLSTRQFSSDEDSTVTQPRDKVRAAIAAAAAESNAGTTVTRPLPPPPSKPTAFAPPPPAQASRPASQTSRSKTPLFAGIAAVLAVAVAAVWYLRRPESPPTPEFAGAIDIDNPVYDAVVPFLATNEWSDRRVANLNAALLELPASEIAEQSGTDWFVALVDEVRRRLKEQQALASHPLTPEKSPLAALAVTIGIDLQKPDAAIRIAVEPPVRKETAPPLRHEEHRVARKKEEKPSQIEPTAAAVTEPKRASVEPALGAAPTATAETNEPAPANPNADACRKSLAGTARAFCRDTLKSGGSGPRLVMVPEGAFDMGSDASPAERPVRRVEIRKPFAISVHEVSQGEFRLYCERAGKTCAAQPWEGEDYPVVNVTWNEAQEYVRWLTNETGQTYRLPTEAEWEYAARAGQTGPYPHGSELSIADAHFSSSARLTAPARRSQQFNPNAWKLMHVLGNAREWVEDSWVPGYDGAPVDGSARELAGSSERVVRGGSFADGAAKLRLSTREGLAASTRDGVTGFRVVRELP